jgi:hypothetical protein
MVPARCAGSHCVRCRALLQVRWLYESSSLKRLQDDGLVLAGLEAGERRACLL